MANSTLWQSENIHCLRFIDKLYLKSNRQGKVETQRAISFTLKAYNQSSNGRITLVLKIVYFIII